eukprot:COSAG02_NODE_6139_length_3774_cov_41.138136_3_plen_672_part_01
MRAGQGAALARFAQRATRFNLWAVAGALLTLVPLLATGRLEHYSAARPIVHTRSGGACQGHGGVVESLLGDSDRCTAAYDDAYLSTLNGDCSQIACVPTCQARIDAVRTSCFNVKYNTTDIDTGVVVEGSATQVMLQALQRMGPVDCDYRIYYETCDSETCNMDCQMIRSTGRCSQDLSAVEPYLFTTPLLGSALCPVSCDACSPDDRITHGWQTDWEEPITCPQTIAGTIPAGGVKWYSFVPAPGTSYEISTTLTTLGDSVIDLYGSDHSTILAHNDDAVGVSDRSSYLHWTCGESLRPPPRIVFIAVRGYSTRDSGGFFLSLAIAAPGSGPCTDQTSALICGDGQSTNDATACAGTTASLVYPPVITGSGYRRNQNCEWDVSLDCLAPRVPTFTFTALSTESHFDIVEISSDGIINAQISGSLTELQQRSYQAFRSHSSIHVQFRSDNSVGDTGFSGTFNCSTPSQPVPSGYGSRCDLETCECDGVSLAALKNKTYHVPSDPQGYSYVLRVCSELPMADVPSGCQYYAEHPSVVKYKGTDPANCIEIGSVGSCPRTPYISNNRSRECGMFGRRSEANGSRLTVTFVYDYGCVNTFTIELLQGSDENPGQVTSNECTYTTSWAALTDSEPEPEPQMPAPEPTNNASSLGRRRGLENAAARRRAQSPPIEDG